MVQYWSKRLQYYTFLKRLYYTHIIRCVHVPFMHLTHKIYTKIVTYSSHYNACKITHRRSTGSHKCVYWEQNILKVHGTKTKYLPCNMHLPYWSSLRYSLVFCLFASGHRTFPIQSTWIGLPLYSKSIFFCSSFNKQGQWLAVVLQFTEKTVYKHKVAFNFN